MVPLMTTAQAGTVRGRGEHSLSPPLSAEKDFRKIVRDSDTLLRILSIVMSKNLFFPSAFATRIRREMRQHKITIKAFARFAGVSQDRVRELRTTGRAACQEEWLLTLRDCARGAVGA